MKERIKERMKENMKECKHYRKKTFNKERIIRKHVWQNELMYERNKNKWMK